MQVCKVSHDLCGENGSQEEIGQETGQKTFYNYNGLKN